MAADVLRCGRPTKSARPCAAILHDPGMVACTLHATDQDRAAHQAYRAGWAAAWSNAYESGRSSGRLEAERAAADTARKAEEALRFRLRDARGQLVIVDGRYTYRWTGRDDLAIGDVVTAPASWVGNGPRSATVTALGSSYEGEIVDLIERHAR